jgi:hypothetical protein
MVVGTSKFNHTEGSGKHQPGQYTLLHAGVGIIGYPTLLF